MFNCLFLLFLAPVLTYGLGIYQITTQMVLNNFRAIEFSLYLEIPANDTTTYNKLSELAGRIKGWPIQQIGAIGCGFHLELCSKTIVPKPLHLTIKEYKANTQRIFNFDESITALTLKLAKVLSPLKRFDAFLDNWKPISGQGELDKIFVGSNSSITSVFVVVQQPNDYYNETVVLDLFERRKEVIVLTCIVGSCKLTDDPCETPALVRFQRNSATLSFGNATIRYPFGYNDDSCCNASECCS